MNESPVFHDTPDTLSEYRHWFRRANRDDQPDRSLEDVPCTLLSGTLDFLQRFEALADQDAKALSDAQSVDAALSDIAPLPGHFANLPDTSDLDMIVAVIDTDMPLGHRSLRHSTTGRSRILYHWEMGAQVTQPGPRLMGREFVQSQIDDMLNRHSDNNDPLQALDEDAFNRDLGALDLGRLVGNRALSMRHAHGAHMLDTVAGTPQSPQNPGLFEQKVGIITINMPSRWQFGEGGEFLDAFMLRAVVRLYQVLRALRRRHSNQVKPLPCVASMAFGRQAGAKRYDYDPFAWLLEHLANRQGGDDARFDLILPVGNDNLDRVTARHVLQPGESMQVDWRMMPGDQSDNYLEAWAEPLTSGTTPVFAVNLVPFGAPDSAAHHLPARGQYFDAFSDQGKVGARVYRLNPRRPGAPPIDSICGYLFAAGPTDPRNDSLATVPPGRWKVMLQNPGQHAIQVNLSVQTDQSVMPVANVSGRSYLDDPTYRLFDDEGRAVDSVRHDRTTGWQLTDNSTGTRRRGTINAAASQNYSAVVGGYRASDGKPAAYSATGADALYDNGREAPTALMPTDDSVAMAGTLSAGSADGSRVAMRGTSFASSKATRLVAETWLTQPTSRNLSAAEVLGQAATATENGPNPFTAAYDPSNPGDGKPKLGGGRTVGPAYFSRTPDGLERRAPLPPAVVAS
ncbi:hypothetical protein [Actibacterium mucosum]|nr:hypothetical protein [Actibacterium mucosum]